MKNETLRQELIGIASCLDEGLSRLRQLLEDRPVGFGGLAVLESERISVDLVWAIENLTVMGLHAVGDKLDDQMGYDVPKYGMQAKFQQNGHIPIVFHCRRIDHKPVQEDLEAFRELLISDFNCAKFMDLIDVGEMRPGMPEDYFVSSPLFRRHGYVHSCDPVTLYNPDLPRSKNDPNARPGEY